MSTYRPAGGVHGGALSLVNPMTCGAACNIAINDVLVTPFRFPTFTIDGVNQIPVGSQVTGVAAIQYYGNAVDPFTGQVSRTPADLTRSCNWVFLG
jgi:hypothetical protein